MYNSVISLRQFIDRRDEFENVKIHTFCRLMKKVMEKIEQEELKKIISNALNELPSRQKEIIFLRYGFNNENPKKLEEIANVFGLTRQRIKQIEKKAFERIRDNKDLKNYLNY